jgi:hypothetical protein
MTYPHTHDEPRSAVSTGAVLGILIGLLLAAVIIFAAVARPWSGDGGVNVDLTPVATQPADGGSSP